MKQMIVVCYGLINYFHLAAHCCKSASTAEAFFADIDRNKLDAGEFTETISIDRIFIHEDYPKFGDGSFYNHDLCIMEIRNDVLVPRSQYCRDHRCTASPCIPKSEFVPGAKCYTAGWGAAGPKENHPEDKLRQIGLNTFSNEYCIKKSYKSYYA